MLTMKTMLTIETYCVIMLTLSSYRAAERGAMAGKRATRATQKSSAGYCQERAGRTGPHPSPLHCMEREQRVRRQSGRTKGTYQLLKDTNQRRCGLCKATP